MEVAYRTTLVCRYDGNRDPSNCTKIGANWPDLLKEGTALSPNDFEKLEYYWTARQDAIAAATPVETYKQFTDLLNEHAKASGKSLLLSRSDPVQFSKNVENFRLRRCRRSLDCGLQ